MPIKIALPNASAALSASGLGERPVRVDVSSLALPTDKTKASQNISDYLIFIYGEKKIGKTSLAAQFPKPLHLFFEPGGKGLETYGMPVAYWEEFVAIVDLLSTRQGEKFDTVVIDTADIAYKLCFDYVCYREGFDHPSDPNDYGKSWNKIRDEFSEQFMRVTQECGKGMIVLSHAVEKTINTKYHGSWEKTVPTLPNQALNWITGAADLNAYYGYYTNPATGRRERRLVIDGSEDLEGGARMCKYNFQCVNGGRVLSIPMGNSDDAAYANLLNAFHNKQEDDGGYVFEWTADLTDRSAVAKVRPGKK